MIEGVCLEITCMSEENDFMRVLLNLDNGGPWLCFEIAGESVHVSRDDAEELAKRILQHVQDPAV